MSNARTIEALASGDPAPFSDSERDLRFRFMTEVWQGCMHYDCIAECKESEHVCGRFESEWRKWRGAIGAHT